MRSGSMRAPCTLPTPVPAQIEPGRRCFYARSRGPVGALLWLGTKPPLAVSTANDPPPSPAHSGRDEARPAVRTSTRPAPIILSRARPEASASPAAGASPAATMTAEAGASSRSMAAGIWVHACVCALDDLAPPHLRDAIVERALRQPSHTIDAAVPSRLSGGLAPPRAVQAFAEQLQTKVRCRVARGSSGGGLREGGKHTPAHVRTCCCKWDASRLPA